MALAVNGLNLFQIEKKGQFIPSDFWYLLTTILREIPAQDQLRFFSQYGTYGFDRHSCFEENVLRRQKIQVSWIDWEILELLWEKKIYWNLQIIHVQKLFGGVKGNTKSRNDKADTFHGHSIRKQKRIHRKNFQPDRRKSADAHGRNHVNVERLVEHHWKGITHIVV